VRVGASEKAKGAWEGFIVNHLIADQCSETEDITRGEGGRAWWSEKLIEWERAAMEEIKGRMDDLGIWARDGSEGVRSS
jgi:hypothetical protein